MRELENAIWQKDRPSHCLRFSVSMFEHVRCLLDLENACPPTGLLADVMSEKQFTILTSSLPLRLFDHDHVNIHSDVSSGCLPCIL